MSRSPFPLTHSPNSPSTCNQQRPFSLTHALGWSEEQRSQHTRACCCPDAGPCSSSHRLTSHTRTLTFVSCCNRPTLSVTRFSVHTLYCSTSICFTLCILSSESSLRPTNLFLACRPTSPRSSLFALLPSSECSLVHSSCVPHCWKVTRLLALLCSTPPRLALASTYRVLACLSQ